MFRRTAVRLLSQGAGETTQNIEHMTGPSTYKGSCRCKSVTYLVEGQPDWVTVTHQSALRKSHASASVLCAGYKSSKFEIHTGGSGYLHRKSLGEEYQHTCKKCGTHIYEDWLPQHKKIIFPTHLECMDSPLTRDWSAFHPQFHIHYNSALLPMYDGLPKFANLPSHWRGGTGELVQEDHPQHLVNKYQSVNPVAPTSSEAEYQQSVSE